MKSLVVFFGLFFSFNVYSQVIDWENAPLNPISAQYKREHFQLKGDVYYYNGKYFDENGYLTSISNSFEDTNFFYPYGRLLYNSKGIWFKFNNQDQLILNGKFNYEYNSKGLISKQINYNKEVIETLYTYDNQNRLIKSEEIVDGQAKTYTNYSYKKQGDVLQISEEQFENGNLKRKNYSEYKNGRKVLAIENGSEIHTKIDYKFDAKGNPIQEDYIQNNGIHDTFSQDILYYSQSNQTNTISLDNSSSRLKINRNGRFAADIIRSTFMNKSDVLLYDGLTKTYYKVDNVFGDNVNKGSHIIPQKLTEGSEALVHTFSKKADLYFRGTNETVNNFKNADIYNATIIDDNLVVYLKKFRTQTETNYIFENFELIENGFFGGDLIQASLHPVFYTKVSDGLMASFKLAIKGINRSGEMKAIGYLKGDVDLVIQNKDKAEELYVLINFAKAESKKVYKAKPYFEDQDGEILTFGESSGKNTISLNKVESEESKTPVASCISGNCTEGFGVLKTSTSTITGFFAAGKANGYGKEVYDDGSGHYEGKFGSGVRSGFGLYYWNSTQQYYIGEWKNGKQHGYGYYKKGNEIFQAGYYENGKQVRNMLTQNFINKKAVGNCIGNCYDGFGFYQFPNNDKYVGFFKNGKKDYVGAYTWASGDAYIGGLLLGSLSGQAMQFYKSTGTTYYGNISNGIRQGMGAYFNKSGDIESKGFWDNGVLKRAL